MSRLIDGRDTYIHNEHLQMLTAEASSWWEEGRKKNKTSQSAGRTISATQVSTDGVCYWNGKLSIWQDTRRRMHV